MKLVIQVFGFFLRDKVRALQDRITWAYLLAGLFVLALVVPELGFLLYFSLTFLAWAVLSGNITRSGLFFFWLPYFLTVGFAVWLSVFPLFLGPVLAVLLTFLISNIFYMLLSGEHTKSAWSKVLLLPLGFFIFEYSFHSLPVISHMELPLLLGLISSHTPVISLALLLGSSLTLAAVVLTISIIISLILNRNTTSSRVALLILTMALFAVANILSTSSFTEGEAGTSIVAVQGSTNYATYGLAGQEYLDFVFERYTALIEGVEADIFVFPEVPMAIYYPAQEKYNGQIFIDLAREKNALVVPLVSEYRLGAGGAQERYITSLLVGPEGILGKSSKRNLVPFSETRHNLPGDDYSSIATPFGQVGIAICYDFNAPHVIGKLKANGAEVILAPFNDTGFGIIFHRMHSHYTIIRALEYNVPIIVANEDGISQLVDRNGRVRASLGHGQQGVIGAHVTLEQKPSYYLLFGRGLEYAVLLVTALGMGRWLAK